MAYTKVLAGGAREFRYQAAFSMDSTSGFMFLYYQPSGPTTSVASGMLTSSGAGLFFCRLTIPTSPTTGYYFARWSIPYATVADAGVATWLSTERIEIKLEGERE